MNGVESLSATKLALLGRKLWSQEGDLRRAEPIAIVGIGCRFPGGANSPEALWELLAEGRDVVREVPEDRWSASAWFDEDPATPGRMNSRWGGFLDDVRGFDAAYFDISPREAERMDPQQRLALEVSVEAIERAGIPLDQLRGAPVGVFFASYHNDYTLLQYADPDTITSRTLTGTLHALVANRISYVLGLRGPSLAVDSACSSSLVATHLACQALRSRDCDVALAGGVSVMVTPHVTVALSMGGFMSPTGRCHTFDAAADGFVRAEGCGVVVLKRLSDAIAAGDPVVGIIRGSAVNQDGESTTLSAPNGLAQEALVRTALRNAGLRAEQVSLIEAHGTGTELGDPIETDALTAAFAGRDAGAGACWLGSIKANVGHLEAAAGVAGLIKTVLCMQHRTIPPHALFRRLSPHVDLGTTFQVATEPTPWITPGPRIAGVSAFGVGGTNAHVLVEEAPAALSVAGQPMEPPFLLAISARSAGALRALAGAYLQRIRAGSDPGELCAAAARRRTHHPQWRVALVAPDAEALVRRLEEVATGARPLPEVPGTAGSRFCFLFTGQGSQYAGMVAALRGRNADFTKAFDEVADAILAAGGPDVRSETERPQSESRLERTEVAQCAIFATEYALVHLLDGWGVRPAAVIGHSIGELAASVAAGMLDLATAANAVVQRGRLMEAAYDRGRMMSVRATHEQVAEAIARSSLTVSIAAINGPTSVVVAGSGDAVEQAAETFAADGLECTRLEVRFPFHSAEMRGPAAELESTLADLRSGVARMPFISTVTGRQVESIDAGYLADNVRSPVAFAAAVESALEAGFRDFIEIGSHPALGRGVLELGERRGVAARVGYCLHRERDDRLTLRTMIAQAYESGAAIDWMRVVPGAVPEAALPTYPWQHTPHWLPDVPDLTRPGAARRGGSRSFPGTRIVSPALSATVFELELADPVFRAFADHRIAGEPRLPATAMAELIRRAAVEVGLADPQVSALGILRPLPLTGEGRVQTILTPREHGALDVELHAGDADGWERVATAEVHPGVPDADPWKGVATVADGEPLARDEFYALLAEQGCDFGEGFRLLDDIVAGPEGAEATIASGSNAAAGVVDPACTDAAAQLCIAVLHARGAAAPGAAFLPWSVDVYRVAGTGLPTHGRVVLREASADAATFDVRLLNASGGLIAELNGWRLRRTSTLPAVLRRVAWLAEPTPPVARPPAGRWWWIDAEGEGNHVLAEAVREAFAEQGRAVEAVSAEAAARLLAHPGHEVEGILFAAIPAGDGDVVGAAARAAERLLPVARALAAGGAGSSRLLVVTRGSQDAGVTHRGATPGGASAWGIVRALRAENPAIQCTCLDLDVVGATPGGAAEDARAVTVEALTTSAVSEVAVRDGARLVARPVPEEAARTTTATGAEVALVHRSPGTLEGFDLEEASTAEPGPGEVRVRVLAAGMNFRDVLTALGSYPGAHEMGHECVGVVDAVGEGVAGVGVGDYVMTFHPGAFRSFVLVPETLVFPAPRGLDPAAVAGVPVAFGTAHYALSVLGEVGGESSVLIHSAAGGVGMAAVQLARAAGAQVFVTAGTPEKRRMLLEMGAAAAFDSRTPEFADQLLAATGGRGVDLVLNSLIGPMIPAGMRALRAGGIFVELGKRERLTTEEAARLRSEVRYVAFDLGDEGRADPTLLPRLFAELRGMLEVGTIRPLPTAVFPLGEAGAAFRRMARAEHVGKLVLVPPPMVDRALAGWVVVTGGGGGVGSATVRWLAANGARRIALWGRRTIPGGLLASLASAGDGIEIRTMEVDVSRREEVDAALAALRVDGDITAVIHSAAVVDDATLAHQDPARLAVALAAKVGGAWHLHEATRGDPIHAFVLYSAAGPLIDAAGQANYAAANAALDELSLHRRGLGLPAVSVQWGPWSGAGMAARLDDSQRERWSRHGLEWWDDATAGPAFEAMLRATAAGVLALRLPERRPAQAAGAARPAAQPQAGGALRSELEATPPALREQLLHERVQRVLLGVLGVGTPPEVDTPLRDAGLDSLSAIELRNALSVACATSLPATLAFDHPSVGAIATYLLRVLELDAAASPTSEPAPVVAESLEVAIRSEVEQLTDEEAEMLLLQELGLMPSTETR